MAEISSELRSTETSELSGERGKRQPSGLSAESGSDPNESIEASSGLKRQQYPLRRLRMRKAVATIKVAEYDCHATAVKMPMAFWAKSR